MEIETIVYDFENEWLIATLENGEQWVVPIKAIPPETDIYEFMDEVIYDARSEGI